MSHSNKETELKLRIDQDSPQVQSLLERSGATYVNTIDQIDILWDHQEEEKSFGHLDQGLRLRSEITSASQISEFTFKGTPHIDASGTRTRDEYNVKIDSPENLEKILESIGFKKAVEVRKRRHNYQLENIDISIDETKFGNFIELEGKKEDIDNLVIKLNFDKYQIETRGYADIQIEWEKNN